MVDERSAFTQRERDAWHRARKSGATWKPAIKVECIHCRQPVGVDGNLDVPLCSACLHND